MKRLLAVALLLAASSLHAGEAARYLVATRQTPGVRQLSILRDPVSLEAHDVRELGTLDAFAATLTEEEAAALRRAPEIRYVIRTVERHILDATPRPSHLTPDASRFLTSQQVPYGVDLVHARELWPLTKGRGPINIAILDTGIDYAHPDLLSNYAGGYNTFTQTDDPFDDNRHGTHVAGTIAALDNSIGVVGVAPEARLWAVKVLNSHGTGEDENVIAGVEWVRAMKNSMGGRWIISMSLGAKESSPVEEEAFVKAIDDGILCIAAAGNTGFLSLQYPAAYPNVLAIGAVDADTKLAGFSSGGPGIGVVAPGVKVLSSVPVGLIPAAGLQATDGTPLDALPMRGSAKGDVTGPFVFCGYGDVDDFAATDVRGKIAVLRRGILKFAEKGRNARAAGAAAVVIVNNTPEDEDRAVWTLIRPDCTPTECHDYVDDVNFNYPITVSLSEAQGEALLKTPGPITVGAWSDDYTTLSGTSMATPHVSGVAALLWALAPDATANDVKNALIRGAHDLGDVGYDPRYGYGLIDAVTSAKQIAPSKFGLSSPPPPTNPMLIPRRRVQH